MRIFIVLLLLTVPAYAAEITLPIKTRILRCTNHAEAQYWCDREKKCCGVHGAKISR